MVLKKAWMAMTALVALGGLSACATSNVGTVSSSSSTSGSGGTGGDTGTGGTTGTGGDTGTGGIGGHPDMAVCGDGKIAVSEVCDDGNTMDGDGCSAACGEFEPGWKCEGTPTKCAPICGDGMVVGMEACDDGNTANGDGCTNACTVALGWKCDGMPSMCATPCGDGIIAGPEECDDSNADAGDGCSDTCAVEPGFTCVMVPSKCASVCGDGIIASNEECDDHNFKPGDGCSDTCKVEQYWTCVDAPSVCATPCGDGIIVGTEVCDDGNMTDGDGCGAACTLTPGYVCAGQPSLCNTVCGDGVVAGSEICDDGNGASGDGCNVFCNVEPGFTCNNAMPTACITTCGDGYPAGAETCDDGNLMNGDGCDSGCKAEHGYLCFNIPSVCATVCGDAQTGGAEQCDDGNNNSGDGCSAGCTFEVGFTCSGEPAVCTGICGDGILIGTETCDDGNLTDGDCCSATCGAETGCEIEINNEAGSANDYGAIAINNVIKGFVKPGNDSDYYHYTFNVAAGAAGALTAETLDGFVGAACNNSTLDSLINIYDANANPIATDNDSGPGLCAVATAFGLQTGDFYIEVKSGKAAGPTPFDYTLQITTQIVVCGDGIVGAGEQCDDGNMTNGDGCSAACHIDGAEYEPNGNPAEAMVNGPFDTNLIWQGSIGPTGGANGDQDYYLITLPATVDLKVETFDAAGPVSCVGMDTLLYFYPADGVTQLATDDDDGPGNCSILNPAADAGMRHLAPGDYFVRVRSFSSAIAAYRVLLTFTATCGNNITEGFEGCDGVGGPNCDANCNVIPACGDGVITAPETCDDLNGNDGDGCSSTCAPEPNYICAGAPSVCTLHENVCGDGLDNDNDTLVDCFDPDCQGQAVCVILPCAVGQTQHVYDSIDTPKPIPDLQTITSIINVADVATVQRAIVKVNITHTFDGDLTLKIASASVAQITLAGGLGGGGNNYTDTVFDSNCLNAIASGAPPFTGCFKPSGAIANFNGSAANQAYTLSITDSANLDSGTLNSWNLVLCTIP